MGHNRLDAVQLTPGACEPPGARKRPLSYSATRSASAPPTDQRVCSGNLEAPPGFEPGMAVLSRTGAGIAGCDNPAATAFQEVTGAGRVLH